MVLAEHRPKEGQLMHLVLAAEVREFFTGNVKRYCFVHRRSCLKTFELANVRQYRTMQSKVTRFRGLCKSLKSLRRRRGRTAGYPSAPAQIPACSIPAPGSSMRLASAILVSRERDLPLREVG